MLVTDLQSSYRFPYLLCEVASVMSDSVQPHGQQSTRLLHPQDSPGRNTGVGCHFLLHIYRWGNWNSAMVGNLFWDQAVSGRARIWSSVSKWGFQCFACICAQLCLTLQPSGLQPTRFLCPWDSPGKNTGVSCHFFLQGIFPDQGSNPPCLLRWQVGAFPLSHLGSPCAAIICYYSDSCTWLSVR